MDTATSNNQGKDLTSIMTQVENLQKQLAVQATELKDTRDREENARKQVDQLNEVNSKLTEAKREAMKQDFNNLGAGVDPVHGSKAGARGAKGRVPGGG